MSNKEVEVCDCCGLPPRLSPSGEVIPLHRCSRCRKALYHDAACQKKHFPDHKKICRKLAAEAAGKKRAKKELCPMFSLEERKGKGRGIFANFPIETGKRISPSAAREYFDPIVLPALNEKDRHERCSWCFNRLEDHSKFRYEENEHTASYPVILCSEQCRDNGREFLAVEERSVKALVDQAQEHHKTTANANVAIIAVLLYRLIFQILREECSNDGGRDKKFTSQLETSTRSFIDDMHSLTWENEKENSVVYMRSCAAQAIQYAFSTCSQLGWDGDKVLREFHVDPVAKIVCKIRPNAVTICDGESLALGIGIFPIVSYMNHSCAPKTLLTFPYGQAHRVPRVRVTACSPISKGEEICIPYIDVMRPREFRRQDLMEAYKFFCTCPSCMSDEIDSKMIGLRCQRKKCSGIGIQQPVVGKFRQVYKCNQCGKTDFHQGQQALDLFTKFTKPPENPTNRDVKQYASVYKNLKSLCSDSSCYVRASGENLLQCLLDSVSRCETSAELADVSARARKVARETIAAYEASDEPCLIGRICIMRFKAAKLSLFLERDPRKAIEELEGVLKDMKLYFPKNHEILMQVTDEIHNGEKVKEALGM